MGRLKIQKFKIAFILILSLMGCSGAVGTGGGEVAPTVAAPGGGTRSPELTISHAMDAPMGAKSDPEVMDDLCQIFPVFGFFYGKNLSRYLEPASALPQDQEGSLPPRQVILTTDIEENGWTMPYLIKSAVSSEIVNFKLRLIKTESADKLVPNYCEDIIINGEKPDGSSGSIENLKVASGEVLWVYYDRRMKLDEKEVPIKDCSKLLKNEAAFREFTMFHCLGFLGAFKFEYFLPSELKLPTAPLVKP